jgi:ribosomal protein L37AE/L43A
MTAVATCCSGEVCPACQTSLTVTDTPDTATWECAACGWSLTLPAATGGSR